MHFWAFKELGKINHFEVSFIVKMFVALIGLVLIFEGLPYAAFPEAMQKWLRQLALVRPVTLRIFGWVAVTIGLLLCYIAQRTGLLE